MNVTQIKELVEIATQGTGCLPPEDLVREDNVENLRKIIGQIPYDGMAEEDAKEFVAKAFNL